MYKWAGGSRRPPQPGLPAWGRGQDSWGHPLGLPQRPQRPAQHGTLPLPVAPSNMHSALSPAGRRGASIGEGEETGGKGRNVTLLLVITAVEFSLFARPGAECFTAFPSYSSPYPVRKGLPPPPLHGGELRPEQVTSPGHPAGQWLRQLWVR